MLPDVGAKLVFALILQPYNPTPLNSDKQKPQADFSFNGRGQRKRETVEQRVCCSTRVRRRRRRPLRKIRLRLNRLIIRVLGKPNYERFREKAGCGEFGQLLDH